MRKFRFGFTIAEVATAMAIIGVVAALTMPQLSKNFQKKQAGALLGRAVEQIELGNKNLINFANSQIANSQSTDGSMTDVLEMVQLRDVTSISNNDSIIYTLQDIVQPYWGLSVDEVAASQVKDLKNYDGSTANTFMKGLILAGKRYNIEKSQSAVAIYNFATPMSPLSDDIEQNTNVWVFIDTNGWDSAPNTFGRDIFLFHVLNGGKLKPYSEGNTGLERTVRVVNDGYKINY